MLIAAGVAGFGAALPPGGRGSSAGLRWGGAAFLLAYGALRLRAALRPGEALRAGGGPAVADRGAGDLPRPHLAQPACLSGHAGADRGRVGRLRGRRSGWPSRLGAAAASFVFFFALGYGARLLAPLCARPSAWRGSMRASR